MLVIENGMRKKLEHTPNRLQRFLMPFFCAAGGSVLWERVHSLQYPEMAACVYNKIRILLL